MDSVMSLLLKVLLFLATLDTFVIGEKGAIREFYYHPLRNSSLLCYRCFNGDKTGDCQAMSNASNIPVLRCKWGETFCKVRRLHTNGELTTFDRQCASECDPGCTSTVIYDECVSCCTTSICNTGNGSKGGPRPAVGLLWTALLIGMGHLVFSG